ncbi:hypothetical protein [Gordonia paraffinivorans]|uniref:hypothetical protein n=1 Tax=Gordonia paraffinivorans TaxID=175628 RepID=UPI001444F41B|nr:hypothetical protein [Gordonia paraffinivorans]
MTRARTDAPISVAAAAVRIAVAIVILAGALTAAGFAWRADRSAAQVEQSRASLHDAAGTVVAEVFSVDAARWRQDRARAREHVTGEFLENYGGQLERPPADGAVSIVWRPEAVAVVDAGAEEGQALIRAAVTVRSAAAAEPATTRRSVLARFVKVGDSWRLAAADVIG